LVWQSKQARRWIGADLLGRDSEVLHREDLQQAEPEERHQEAALEKLGQFWGEQGHEW
jgi:hypothetical protein